MTGKRNRRRWSRRLSVALALAAAEEFRLVNEGSEGALRALGAPNANC